MGSTEGRSTIDVDRVEREAWFGELVGSLDRLEVYGMAILIVDVGTGDILGSTPMARAHLGGGTPTSLAELDDAGTIARPDLARLRRHLGGLTPGREADPTSDETTESWSDQLRIHRTGASPRVLHIEGIVHRRPAVGAEVAVLTMWLDEDPAGRSDESSGDLEDLWVIYDERFRMIAADPGFADLGIDPRSQLGTYAWMYVHPDDVPTAHPLAVAVMDGRLRTARYSVRLRALNGRWLPVEIEVRRLVADDGPRLVTITRYVNTARKLIPADALSLRELAVVRGLFDGLRVGQIAEQHQVAVKTVRNQLAGIYRKLGVAGQVDLLATFHRPAEPSPLAPPS